MPCSFDILIIINPIPIASAFFWPTWMCMDHAASESALFTTKTISEMHIHHENSQWLQLHARTTIIPIDSYRYHIYIYIVYIYTYIVYIYTRLYTHIYIYTHETMCCIPYLWCSPHHKPNISEQCSEPLLVDSYMGLYGVLTIQYIILFNRYFQVFSLSHWENRS